MLLDQYCTEINNNKFAFSRQQASNFAKQVANDFNPIHDVDAKKFCVPGDLLFAKILTSQGLHTNMDVQFSGMVAGDVELGVDYIEPDQSRIVDNAGKEYLSVHHTGDKTMDQALIEKLVRGYVAFSGESFPHVLVPLMRERNVMINAVRPLVIYESMSVHLDRLDLDSLTVETTDTQLEVKGKRGKVTLCFAFKDNGQVVGTGKKTMLLSGLREFDQNNMDAMVLEYTQRRMDYAA